MTDLHKAAEQALEALENVYGKGKRCEAAIKEVRQALAQPDLARVGEIGVWGNSQALAESANSTTDFVEPKASSQPEQEPVAYVTGYFGGHLTITCFDPALVLPDGLALYTAPPKQEYQYEVVAEHADGTYTTRRIPKREWVGLTDDEIYDYADKFLYQHGSNYGIRSFGKAVEAKLKEKNT